MHKTTSNILLLSLLTVLLNPASASIIAEDTFDTYPDGPLAGQDGGDGWGGAWGSGNLQVSSGHLIDSPTNINSYSQSRVFSEATTTGSTMYFSMYVNITSPEGDNTYVTRLSFGSSADPDGFGFFGIVNGEYRVDVGGYTNAGSYTLGETVLLVCKLEFDVSGTDDRLTLWVNPDTTEAGSTSTVSRTAASSTGATSIEAIEFDYANMDGVLVIDDLRIGTTWDDVVTVPETSSFALFAGGIGVLLIGSQRLRNHSKPR
ncbi:MAG: hypothetical protein Q7Q73_08595 [Verrucomicrobiota bacterium JB024]|nr:hypothetical protein [Verrucomicrobiota bacterium JB024]